MDYRPGPARGNRQLNPPLTIAPADIRWSDNRPHAVDFDDIYFSDDGIQETLRVFVEPNNLLTRMQHQPELCVGELGFGTGLNFAVLAGEVLKHSSARLRFISFEKAPLRPGDWHRVFSDRAAALPIYAELQHQTLPLLRGWHQRILADGRVVLNVYHGEIQEGLTDLANRQKNPVDAWFLDGFAPSKNPAMWTPDLYRLIAALAHRQTTVATFTAAGHVRRGLQAAGFAMRKVNQQPHKRESLAGHFQGRAQRRPVLPPDEVTVHGAGMAGAFTARHLAEAGVPVKVYDPAGIANAASAMPASVLHSRLIGDTGAEAMLRSSAFHYASAYMCRFHGFKRTGVMWMQGPNLNGRKLERIAATFDADNPDQQPWIQRLSARESSLLTGAPIPNEALHHPGGGVVDAPALCADLLNHAQIEVIKQHADSRSKARNVVCTSTAARLFPGCDWLEISDVYGQLDWYSCPAPVAAMPVVGNGYLVPTPGGCVLGATYEHTPWAADRATSHNRELNRHMVEKFPLTWLYRKRGARCVASDRTPVVGRLEINTPPGGLWLCTALGSMGTTAGVLAAAVLAADLTGWLPPLDPDVLYLLRPERFRERQARRGIRHIYPRRSQ